MFCPSCGSGDQKTDSFCRKCGTFLPHFDKAGKREKPPSEHISANAVLSALSVVTSFTLAVLLYVNLAFRPDTPVLIYVIGGFLLAMGGWHIQTFIRTMMLRKQLKSWGRLGGSKKGESSGTFGNTDEKRLDAADLSSHIPVSVTELTTRDLSESRRPLP